MHVQRTHGRKGKIRVAFYILGQCILKIWMTHNTFLPLNFIVINSFMIVRPLNCMQKHWEFGARSAACNKVSFEHHIIHQYNKVTQENNSLLNKNYSHVSFRIITFISDYRQGLDWIYWHLYTITLNNKQYSTVTDLHSLQFTVTHALGFLLFIGCILATDL